MLLQEMDFKIVTFYTSHSENLGPNESPITEDLDKVQARHDSQECS